MSVIRPILYHGTEPGVKLRDTVGSPTVRLQDPVTEGYPSCGFRSSSVGVRISLSGGDPLPFASLRFTHGQGYDGNDISFKELLRYPPPVITYSVSSSGVYHDSLCDCRFCIGIDLIPFDFGSL